MREKYLDGHVLRSGDQRGLEQEIWALLTLYQLLRMAMVTAVESRPDTNPDRASFTTALQAARDQLVAAEGILPAEQPDLLGVIGRAVLCSLLPPRRPRWSTRKVKNATSRHLNRNDGRPDRPTNIIAINIALYTPTVDASWRPRYRKRTNPHTEPTRRERITTLMKGEPRRPWSGRELADTSVSNPATCSLNSPSGPAWASSPAQAPAPTPSRPAGTPRVLDPRLRRLTPRHCYAVGLRPSLDPDAELVMPTATGTAKNNSHQTP